MPDATTEDQDRAAVRALLRRINDAWLAGDPDAIPDAMRGTFAERAVVRGPGFQLLCETGDAAVASYAGFLRQAKVLRCELADPEVDLAGDTAVATYGWTMTYELAGETYTERGHDLFVLARTPDGWRAVWRALLPSPAPQP